MLSLVKQYVAEMGVTDNFYQQMVNTETSQMVIYKDNYKKLAPEYDPVYQEVQSSYDARHYGVTTSEMRERERDAQGCFMRKDMNGWARWNCAEALRWGLSEGVYRERSGKKQECRLDDDFKLLLAMPKKERRDHPLWVKWETCERNTMLRR